MTTTGRKDNTASSSTKETTDMIELRQRLTISLPSDLVEEILCRLPVKNLRQLCCVSKSWNSLICYDSKFAKKHLRFSTSTDGGHHLAVSSMMSSSPRVFLLSHCPISCIFSNSASITSVTQLSSLSVPYQIEVSTYDGILCFGIHYNCSVILWNPSIRKFKTFPPLNGASPLTSYTLGYDSYTDNYKIIACTYCYRGDNSKKQVVNIHTLGTDYWRKVEEDFPCHYYYDSQPGVFMNENVNWLANAYDDRSLRVIVSFDLKKETYQKPLHCKQFGTYPTLGVLRDCLCIVSDDNHKFFDVWIMEEYGNEKSWIKLLKIPRTTDCGGYCFSTNVLHVSKDGQVLMECKMTSEDSLVVYDSVNNTFKIPKIQNNIYRYIILSKVYVESLILSSFF